MTTTTDFIETMIGIYVTEYRQKDAAHERRKGDLDSLLSR